MKHCFLLCCVLLFSCHSYSDDLTEESSVVICQWSKDRDKHTPYCLKHTIASEDNLFTALSNPIEALRFDDPNQFQDLSSFLPKSFSCKEQENTPDDIDTEHPDFNNHHHALPGSDNQRQPDVLPSVNWQSDLEWLIQISLAKVMGFDFSLPGRVQPESTESLTLDAPPQREDCAGELSLSPEARQRRAAFLSRLGRLLEPVLSGYITSPAQLRAAIEALVQNIEQRYLQLRSQHSEAEHRLPRPEDDRFILLNVRFRAFQQSVLLLDQHTLNETDASLIFQLLSLANKPVELYPVSTFQSPSMRNVNMGVEPEFRLSLWLPAIGSIQLSISPTGVMHITPADWQASSYTGFTAITPMAESRIPARQHPDPDNKHPYSDSSSRQTDTQLASSPSQPKPSAISSDNSSDESGEGKTPPENKACEKCHKNIAIFDALCHKCAAAPPTKPKHAKGKFIPVKSDSTQPSSKVRAEKVKSILEEETVQDAEDKVKEYPDIYIKTALEEMVAQNKYSNEYYNYVLGVAYLERYLKTRSENAIKNARTNLELALDKFDKKSLFYFRTRLLMGKVNMALGVITEEDADHFMQAYQAGIPEAGLYCMLIKSGVYLNLCQLKWIDFEGILDIASKLPELNKSYKDRTIRDSINPILKDAYNGKERADIKLALRASMTNIDLDNFTTVDFFPATFPIYLYHLFRNNEQKLKTVTKDWEGSGKDNEVISNIVDHALLKAKKNIDNVRVNSLPSAHLAMISLLNDGEKEEDLDAFKNYQKTPPIYDKLISSHIKNKEFEKALQSAKSAQHYLEQFLKGEEYFYDRRVGEQAEALKKALKKQSGKMSKQARNNIVHEVIVNELHTADALLRKYQTYIDVLEWAVSENLTRKEAPSRPPELQAKVSDVQSKMESDIDEASAFHPGKSNQEVPSSDNSMEESPGKIPDFTVIKIEDSSPEEGYDDLSDQILEHVQIENSTIKAKINYTNMIMRKYSQLDEAEQLLNSCQPEKRSLQWYRKEQSLCWLLHEKATSEHYINSHKESKETYAAFSLPILEKAQNKARELIKELVILSNNEALYPAEDYDTQDGKKRYLSVAQALNAMDEGLRKQYGGLFSTLGHLQKAYIDRASLNERELDSALKQGRTYYDIANDIRYRQQY